MKHALLVLAIPAALAVLASPLAHADPELTPAQRNAANDAFQRGNWPAAAKAYAAIVAVEDHPAHHGRYGTALVEVGKPADAIPHLEKALSIIPNPRFAFYLARAHARLNNADAAFTALDKMVAMGGVPVATLAAARELAALADHKRFTDVVAKNRAAVEPCRAAPEFRQFDFWIGEWTVKDPKGNTAGTSSIQLILGSCVIFENWTGGGSIGKSFNIYDTNDKKWHQTWTDDRGTFTHYIGSFTDGKMVLVADQPANGKPGLARMTFSKLPGGEVRQHGESSTDAGKTWTTTFDLVYSKRT
ncbi:MAG TPA: tetratricopeptide repeat protein [Kofleriaceae bacterium]|nr:tetratricopeptide repeat protein [Kofleriaceae bacterium]